MENAPTPIPIFQGENGSDGGSSPGEEPAQPDELPKVDPPMPPHGNGESSPLGPEDEIPENNNK